MNSRRRPEQTGFEISRKRPPSKLDLRFPESAPSRLDSRFPESAPSRLDSRFPKAPRADWIRDSKKCPERILSGSFLKCQMLSAKHGSKTLVPRGRGSFHPKTQGFCNIDFLESAPSKSFGAFSGVASGVGAAEVRGRTSFQTNSDSQTAKLTHRRRYPACIPGSPQHGADTWVSCPRCSFFFPGAPVDERAFFTGGSMIGQER